MLKETIKGQIILGALTLIIIASTKVIFINILPNMLGLQNEYIEKTIKLLNENNNFIVFSI